MKARVIITAAFLAASISLIAQENGTKEKITYSNVTEFGLLTASPKGVAFEATTAHGVSFDKQHNLGLGFGIGVRLYTTTYSDPYYFYTSKRTNTNVYMPIFLNYRLYFRPEKTFSPHMNIAVGGLMQADDGKGMYSSITMGFRAGKFSFSSCISLMAVNQQETVTKYYDYVDPYNGYIYTTSYSVREWKWSYPFGITLKWGFSF